MWPTESATYSTFNLALNAEIDLVGTFEEDAEVLEGTEVAFVFPSVDEVLDFFFCDWCFC